MIGVCAEAAPTMYDLFYDTAHPQVWETLAEALSGRHRAGLNHGESGAALRRRDRPGARSRYRRGHALAVVKAGWVVEGGGVVGIAALRSGVVEPDTRRTVVVISGGNVDEDVILRILNTE